MALYVHKYGGTSLSTAGRIRDIAARLAQVHEEGHGLVVVVSAMGGTTNQLLSLAHEISARPAPRELDMLLTTGERVSMALLSMALEAVGLDAISLTGSQCGIITDGNHSRARIIEIRGDRIQEALELGRIVIVAGFQGVSLAREITTLGRGGSDITAVALAAHFHAARCDIFTDVDGVYSANPGRVGTARRLERLDHASMATYARLGAGVLHARAARRAARHAVPLRIVSSFIPGRGTEVGGPLDGVPPVIGVGNCRVATRLDCMHADGPAVARQIDDAGLSCLAAAALPTGGIGVFVPAGDADEARDLLTAQLEIPVYDVHHGALVAVVSRPDVDPRATFEALVPPGERKERAVASEPGAVMALVDPARADATVLELHRQLVEEPAGSDVSADRPAP
jgi:aspartokinase